MLFMEKKSYLYSDLLLIRAFMKEKKITIRKLTEEMEYSYSHLTTVFTGASPPNEKFMKSLFKGITHILQKDLIEFYKLLQDISAVIPAGKYFSCEEKVLL